MVSTTPLARGLGPLETIVNVGWPTAPPVYVCLSTTASRSGLSLGQTPLHTAVATLSPAAIAKGATIELNVSNTALFFGDHQMFNLLVIKVPKLVTGKLFTLVLAGTHQVRAFPDPSYFCGTYTTTQTKTLTDTINIGGNLIFEYHVVVTYTTPAATTTFADFVDYQFDGTLAGVNVLTETFLSFFDGSNLVRTNFRCDETPPPGKPENFPFDLTMQINPIKDHAVTNPGYPYDTTEAVRKPPDFGDDTALWYTFIEGNTDPLVNGVLDCTLDFHMRNHKLCSLPDVKDKFIEVYPMSTGTTAARTVYWNAFGRPRIKKNKPLPTSASPGKNPYSDNRFTAPSFNTVRLYSGTVPPTINFDPFTTP